MIKIAPYNTHNPLVACGSCGGTRELFTLAIGCESRVMLCWSCLCQLNVAIIRNSGYFVLNNDGSYMIGSNGEHVRFDYRSIASAS